MGPRVASVVAENLGQLPLPPSNEQLRMTSLNSNRQRMPIVDLFVDVVHLDREPAILAVVALAVVRTYMTEDATSISTRG